MYYPLDDLDHERIDMQKRGILKSRQIEQHRAAEAQRRLEEQQRKNDEKLKRKTDEDAGRSTKKQHST